MIDKLSVYSFDDIDVFDFRYNSIDRIIEVSFPCYIDFSASMNVYRKTKLIISKWKKAESSKDGKIFEDLESNLGIFGTIQKIKIDHDSIKLYVLTVTEDYDIYKFKSAEMQFVFLDNNVLEYNRDNRNLSFYFSSYYDCNTKQNLNGKFKLLVRNNNQSMCRIYGRQHFLYEKGYVHVKAFNSIKEIERIEDGYRVVLEDINGDLFEYFFYSDNSNGVELSEYK